MTTQVDAIAERHRVIADQLEALGRVEVVDLADRLDVAPETIRRDLRLLEQQGLLQRVHGGAVRRTERPLSPFDGATPEHPASHVGVAEQVADALPISGSVYLGASPLTWAVAESLSRRSPGAGLTVVTTSLDVAVLMSRVDNVHVYNIGGSVEQTDRAQQGDWALAELGRFRVDLAVLSPSGVTVGDGLFAQTPMAAAVVAAEVATTSRIWLLLESERLGRPGHVRAAPIDGVEQIFTAGLADAARRAPFRDAGIVVTGSEIAT